MGIKFHDLNNAVADARETLNSLHRFTDSLIGLVIPSLRCASAPWLRRLHRAMRDYDPDSGGWKERADDIKAEGEDTT